jgi:hypothetical protein
MDSAGSGYNRYGKKIRQTRIFFKYLFYIHNGMASIQDIIFVTLISMVMKFICQ